MTETWISFFITAVLFGVGLAMDAFSVSVARGLAEPEMPGRRACVIAGVFGVFQTGMPLIGYVLVRAASETFAVVQSIVPYAALILLALIGGGMIREGLQGAAPGAPGDEAGIGGEAAGKAGFRLLLVQGVATSIDALSVGLDTASLSVGAAVAEAVIIGIVTFAICMFGLFAGSKLGERIGSRAPILGGVILIGIGLKIFLGSF